MKRRFTKFAAIGMASALIMSLSAVSASAANYTPVAGSNTSTFNKYLIMEKDTAVPELTFNYTIAPGTAQAATASTMAVLAGVGSPTITGATFTDEQTTYNTVQTGDNDISLVNDNSANDKVVNLNGNVKYAKSTATLNFSGVTFDEPGIYRYIVTEQEINGVNGVYYDTQKPATATTKQRILDVYVTDNNGTLEVSSYVLHASATTVDANATNGSSDVAHAGDAVDDKSAGYVNEYKAKNLEFGKEIEGNQGAKDKYFKFTLAITNALPNTTYTVDLSGAEAAPTATTATTYTSMANAATITTDENGDATVNYYLKDGQYVKVQGLPEAATYKVTEAAEDYKSTATIDEGVAKYNEIAHDDAVSGTIADDDVYTGYVNTRDGVIPTGVIVTIAPFAIGILLFGALGLFMVSKRRRETY